MALEKQTKELPLAGGIGEGVDEKVLPEGRMLELRNCYFEKPGQLRKRTGLRALSRRTTDAGQIAQGVSIASHNNEVIAMDGARAYSFSSDGAKAWVDKGPLQFPDVRTRVAIPSLTDVDNLNSWDGATAGGISLFVYGGELSSSEPLLATVVDAETGAAIISEAQIDTEGYLPRVITADDQVLGIAYAHGAGGGDIRYAPLDDVGTPDIAFGVVQTLVNNDLGGAAAIQFPIPLAVVGLNALAGGRQRRWAFAYVSAASGDLVLDIRNADGTQAATTSTTITAPSVLRAMWLSQNKVNGDIYIWAQEYNPSRILYYRPFDSAGTALAALSTVINVPKRWVVAASGVSNLDDEDDMTLFYGAIDDGLPTAGPRETNRTDTAVVDNAGAVVTAAAVFRGNVVPFSEAFTWRGRHYLFAYNLSGSSPSTAFMLDGDADVVTRFYPLAATPDTFDPTVAHTVSHLGGGKWMVTSLSTISAAVEVVSAAQNAVVLDLAEVIVDLQRIGRVSQVLANTTSNFGAGSLSIYDGSRMAESGFHFGPGAATASVNTAGGTMAAGVYEFLAVYFWRDNDGNEHYSRVGDVNTITLGANEKIDADFATYRISDRPGVKVLFYRSLVGATGGPYYLAGTTDNDTSVEEVTIISDLTDAQAGDNPTLYTTGGVLDNNAPPPAVHMWDNGQTAFLIAADDRRSLWVSKPISSRLALEWSGLLVSRMPTGEELTAGGSIDSNVILFGRNSIRVLLGSAPTANGGGGYPQTRPISSEVGCDDPRSVVQFRGGIVFRSTRGFSLLDRSLQVQFIGGPVEDRSDANVLAATVITRSGIGHIRFLMETGEVLVWDYIMNAWSTFEEPAAACCTNWQDQYACIQPDGTVLHKQDREHFRDIGEPYLWGCRFPWIKASGFSGWQRTKRIHILGEHRSAHNLDVNLYNGYNGSEPVQTRRFESDDVGTATGQPYQVRIRPLRQKAPAVSMDLSIDAPDGEGLRLTSAALEIGAKRGGAKLPDSASG